MHERQVTCASHSHMLTNVAVWSADSRWIVYDTRSSLDGSIFDGTRIERTEVESGRVELLYASQHGGYCGVVTASPVDDRVVFILGPEHPTDDWQYGPARRQGVVVRMSQPGVIEPLDARDLVPPFTSGALRGGSHVHVFSPDGRLVSFTYEDAVLDGLPADAASVGSSRETSLRGIGVSLCGQPVPVPQTHPRNHGGTAFTVLVTRLTDEPTPGSDEISKAFEEAWIGSHGYLRPDGSRQRYALAFQGHVVTAAGQTISEVFVCDLPMEPQSFMVAGDQPLQLLVFVAVHQPNFAAKPGEARLKQQGHHQHQHRRIGSGGQLLVEAGTHQGMDQLLQPEALGGVVEDDASKGGPIEHHRGFAGA